MGDVSRVLLGSMRIGIGFKLFVAVLVASTVMAVAMNVANRISFQRGFLGYLNEIENRRLNMLTGILAAHWREAGDPAHGWDAFRGRDDLWRYVVRYSGYRLHSGQRPMPVPPLPGRRPLQLCQWMLPWPDDGVAAPAHGSLNFPGGHDRAGPADGVGIPGPGQGTAPLLKDMLANGLLPDGMSLHRLVPGEASADVGKAADWWWLSNAAMPVDGDELPATRALGRGVFDKMFWPDDARANELAPADPQLRPPSFLGGMAGTTSVVSNGAYMLPPLPGGSGWPGDLPKPPLDAASRMTLQDASGRFVVGNPEPGADVNFVPILVDGLVAGWVGSQRFTEVTDAADLAFQRRQESAAWYIAGLAVLLAAVIAWLLGRVMLVPARRLVSATRALAAGRYDIRVPVSSQDELGQLARVFNRLAGTLQSNEDVRRAFMADVSHELRTPLAIMRGELEAVEDGLQPLDQRVLQSLQGEVLILSKLVDDIHMLSMTEVAPLAYHWERVDVVGLLDSTLSNWQERLAVRGLSLKRVGVIDRMFVTGDPNRLRQVFQNLLENALRYVDQGGTVQVGCQAANPGVIIDFDDSGPGMPAEDYPRLFDRFYRREASRNRATGGSGLGLAICRGIVDAHGGRIVAKASPLGGLRIRIGLPPEHSSEGNG